MAEVYTGIVIEGQLRLLNNVFSAGIGAATASTTAAKSPEEVRSNDCSRQNDPRIYTT